MKIDVMVPRLKLLWMTFIAALLFASCTKEYSFENGGTPGVGQTGTGVFTFTGAPAACTGAVVSGVYTAGTALTASNTVVVSVSVATIGTYSVSTAVVNGISFTGSGTFTATGVQTITLTGTGTPVAAGSFNFSTSATGCGFSISVVAAGPVAVATLDCTTSTPSGTYTQYIALASTNTVSIPVTVTTAGSYSITTTVSGATFSGAGTLATGAQTIVLTGSGIATVAGVLSFPISLGTSACNFSVTFLPGALPSTDYFRCSVDGVATTFNVSLVATSQVLATGGQGISIDGDQTTATNTASLSLNLLNLTSSIATGPYNLVSLSPPSTIFCEPIYDDGTDSWNPSATSAPTEFVVTVTAITANRITGTFSGIVYDNGGAGMVTKIFTNGEFSVPY